MFVLKPCRSTRKAGALLTHNEVTFLAACNTSLLTCERPLCCVRRDVSPYNPRELPAFGSILIACRQVCLWLYLSWNSVPGNEPQRLASVPSNRLLGNVITPNTEYYICLTWADEARGGTPRQGEQEGVMKRDKESLARGKLPCWISETQTIQTSCLPPSLATYMRERAGTKS